MINKKGVKIKPVTAFYLFLTVLVLILVKSSSQIDMISQVERPILRPAIEGKGTIQLQGSGDLFDMNRGEAGKVANVEGHDLFCIERGTNFAKGCKEGVTAEAIAKLKDTTFEVHPCSHSDGLKKDPYAGKGITSMPVLVQAGTIDLPTDVAYIMSQPDFDYNDPDSRRTAQNAMAEIDKYKKGSGNITNGYSVEPPWEFPPNTTSNTDAELGELEPGTYKNVVEHAEESTNYETFKETVETIYGGGGVKVVDIDENNNQNIEAWVNQKEGTITLRTI